MMNVDLQKFCEDMAAQAEAKTREEARKLGLSLAEFEAYKAREDARKADPRRPRWIDAHDGIQPKHVLEAIYDGKLEQDNGILAVDRWLESENGPPCLVLLGGTGAGKTVAALHAMRKVEWSRFVRAPELGAHVRPTIDERRIGQREMDPRRMSLLVLDDLGAEQLTPRFAEALFLTIDARQDVRRRTIITSNLGKEDFRPRYDSRVVDRLNSIARVISLGGQSRRQQRAGL